MSTLDEITKEKQRIGEALARVDAQREKLTGQLGELEAAERVLARYGKGTPARKTASANTPTTATKAAAAPRPRLPRTRAEEPAALALRPAHSRGHQFVTRYPKASDISSPPCLLRLLPAGANRRWGLAPTGKRRLITAHPRCWSHRPPLTLIPRSE